MLFSLYPRVLIKLGDERYEYDRSTLKYTEMAAIERACGMSYAEWQIELGRSSILAIGALLTVLRKRAGKPADFETLEFNVADLDWVPLHEDGTEFTAEEVTADIERRAKEGREPGPTEAAVSAASPETPAPGTTGDTSRSSPKSSTSGPGSGKTSPPKNSSGAKRMSTPG